MAERLPRTPPDGWTLASLTELFASDPEALGDVDVEVAGGTDVLRVTLKDRGGLDVLVAASGEQILAGVLLTRADDVPRREAFERFLLSTHKLVPLSTFGITSVNGEEWYELFGALSSRSRITSRRLVVIDAVTTAIVTRAIRTVQTALISGVTPRRTWL